MSRISGSAYDSWLPADSAVVDVGAGLEVEAQRATANANSHAAIEALHGVPRISANKADADSTRVEAKANEPPANTALALTGVKKAKPKS